MTLTCDLMRVIPLPPSPAVVVFILLFGCCFCLLWCFVVVSVCLFLLLFRVCGCCFLLFLFVLLLLFWLFYFCCLFFVGGCVCVVVIVVLCVCVCVCGRVRGVVG